MIMRTTRSFEKKRKLDEGIVEEPKPKIMTLGKHLALERQAKEEQLLEIESVAQYEQFTNYSKASVLTELSATEVKPEVFTDHDFYETKDTKILFLTLKTAQNPKHITHFCNSSCLQWNVEHLHITSDMFWLGLPNVVMVFVRGKHVAGTSLTSDDYKYLGLVGCQSISSGGNGKGQHEYIKASLVFDYKLSRKEMEMFGANVMNCRKNKYGCTLCGY